jgi:segregation and condensation protein B
MMRLCGWRAVRRRGPMNPELKTLVEALLFAADEPLSLRRLSSVLEEATTSELRLAVNELNAAYDAGGSALQIQEIAGGYQLLTRAELAPWVSRLIGRGGRPRLSQPALETLAIIAYKQPVTRVELEEIRGVNVEAVLRTLVERELVSIVGRDEGLGRPLLYGTTAEFLSYFGLNSTADLPRLDELEIFLAEREVRARREGPPDEGSGETDDAGHRIPQDAFGGDASHGAATADAEG